MRPMKKKDYDQNYDWQSTFFIIKYEKALLLTVLFIRLRLNSIEGIGGVPTGRDIHHLRYIESQKSNIGHFRFLKSQ